jgi:hypothetical protein
LLAEASPTPERARAELRSAGQGQHRVRMLGLDGIDLRVVEQLLAESRPLPNFRRLLVGGVSAPMQTVSSHSPLIWTSIVTGMAPEIHGVTDYVTPYLKGTALALPAIRGDVLGRNLTRVLGLREIGAVTSRQRRTPALWEILSDFGHRVLVLNWWASYPADAVRGTLISNQAIPWTELTTGEIERIRGRLGLVYPPELQPEVLDEISRLIAAPRYRGVRFNFEISPFAGGTSSPPEHVPSATMVQARSLALGAQQNYFASRDELAFALHEHLADSTIDFQALYLQGVDIASHVFTAEVFGGDGVQPLPPQLAEPRTRELWETLVVQAYLAMDARIGHWLEALEPDEVLLVVSDHGWNYDGTAHNGAPDGVFFAYGAPFNAGLRLPRVHVFDVLPTLGRLLEVPVSKALPGRVLDEAFAPEVRERLPARPVEAYRPRAPAQNAQPRHGDSSYAARLRALGYVQ